MLEFENHAVFLNYKAIDWRLDAKNETSRDEET